MQANSLSNDTRIYDNNRQQGNMESGNLHRSLKMSEIDSQVNYFLTYQIVIASTIYNSSMHVPMDCKVFADYREITDYRKIIFLKDSERFDNSVTEHFDNNVKVNIIQ